jgi:hypothetical protein
MLRGELMLRLFVGGCGGGRVVREGLGVRCLLVLL